MRFSVLVIALTAAAIIHAAPVDKRNNVAVHDTSRSAVTVHGDSLRGVAAPVLKRDNVVVHDDSRQAVVVHEDSARNVVAHAEPLHHAVHPKTQRSDLWPLAISLDLLGFRTSTILLCVIKLTRDPGGSEIHLC